MPSSCKEIRALLAECLQNSDCVMVHRHTAIECLRPPLVDTLPTRCQQLKHGYGECKRGMIDMRKRFRGNAPAGLPADLEGKLSGPSAGGQLYAGKPAVGAMRATTGNEEKKEE